MLRYALALVLFAMPALAQTQGAPGTANTHPRALPGTGGTTAVPDTGQTGNVRSGSTNNSNGPPPGSSGAKMPFSTGPLQGGGGPQGQHSSSPR